MTKRKGRSFVNGKVWVRKRRCSTCVFGNNSPVSVERREQMRLDSDRDGGCIPCHHHIHQGEPIEPVCNGYFHVNNSIPLRLADAMGYIEWYDDRD
jgi:hypothetical protein